MSRERRNMTARIVPLRSDAAGDARVDGPVDERVALVAELTRRVWAISGREFPTYTRRDIPFRLTSLAEQ